MIDASAIIWPRPKTLFERMSEAQRLEPRPFALTTGDPLFDPAAPITVNGYRYEPADQSAGGGNMISGRPGVPIDECSDLPTNAERPMADSGSIKLDIVEANLARMALKEEIERLEQSLTRINEMLPVEGLVGLIDDNRQLHDRLAAHVAGWRQRVEAVHGR